MSAIVNRIRKFLQGVGRYGYRAEGSIVFQFCPTENRECPAEVKALLKASIVKADEAYPWKNKNGLGDPLPSIEYLSDGKDQFNNWRGGELNVWFRVVPCGSLHKCQIHAYEHYLENLAKEIAEKNQVPGVVEVRCVFQIHSSKVYETRQ